MTNEEALTELLRATRALSQKVDNLGANLHIAQTQQQRTKMLVIMVTVLSIFCLIGLGGTAFAVQQNKENAKTTCENANESRKANQVLWSYVIGLSRRGADEAEMKVLNSYQDWIDELYAPRDCDQLDKKYPIPDPPAIPPTGKA